MAEEPAKGDEAVAVTEAGLQEAVLRALDLVSQARCVPEDCRRPAVRLVDLDSGEVGDLLERSNAALRAHLAGPVFGLAESGIESQERAARAVLGSASLWSDPLGCIVDDGGRKVLVIREGLSRARADFDSEPCYRCTKRGTTFQDLAGAYIAGRLAFTHKVINCLGAPRIELERFAWLRLAGEAVAIQDAASVVCSRGCWRSLSAIRGPEPIELSTLAKYRFRMHRALQISELTKPDEFERFSRRCAELLGAPAQVLGRSEFVLESPSRPGNGSTIDPETLRTFVERWGRRQQDTVAEGTWGHLLAWARGEYFAPCVKHGLGIAVLSKHGWNLDRHWCNLPHGPEGVSVEVSSLFGGTRDRVAGGLQLNRVPGEYHTLERDRLQIVMHDDDGIIAVLRHRRIGSGCRSARLMTLFKDTLLVVWTWGPLRPDLLQARCSAVAELHVALGCERSMATLAATNLESALR